MTIRRKYSSRSETLLVAIGEDKLIVSAAHPFLLAEGGWIKAGALREGSILRSLETSVRVLHIEQQGIVDVFNIEVDEPHTYLVGQQGIVVHNK